MFFSYTVFVWAFAIIILSTEATVRGRGRVRGRSTCREPTIFQNINITGVLGHWYEYSRHDHNFERGCDCLTTEVELVDATSFQITNCCQMTNVSNETQNCNIGIDNARTADVEKNEALFFYNRTGVESQLWIVDADYDSYFIANACDRTSDNEENELFWIFTRDRTISEDVVNKINNVLRANNFERSKIIRQRHGADVCKSKRPPRRHGGRGRSHRHHGNRDRSHSGEVARSR